MLPKQAISEIVKLLYGAREIDALEHAFIIFYSNFNYSKKNSFNKSACPLKFIHRSDFYFFY